MKLATELYRPSVLLIISIITEQTETKFHLPCCLGAVSRANQVTEKVKLGLGTRISRCNVLHPNKLNLVITVCSLFSQLSQDSVKNAIAVFIEILGVVTLGVNLGGRAGGTEDTRPSMNIVQLLCSPFSTSHCMLILIRNRQMQCWASYFKK